MSSGYTICCVRQSSSIPESIPSWVPGLFRALAVPRLTGSAAIGEARATVEHQLREWGYAVLRQHFVTSSVRLSAVSVLGAGIGWLALILYPLFVLPLPGWPVSFVGVSGLLLVSVIAVGMASGKLPSAAPGLEAVNLEARRGEPKLWLVAHIDSKGQRLSLRGRVIAVIVFGMGCAAVMGALAVRPFGQIPWWAALGVTVLALVGGGAMSLGVPRDDSPGAVDNATGVIAALVAAGELADRTDIGVLVTDGEELGMEGARAWTALGGMDAPFVNFDSVDSVGRYRIALHAPRASAAPPWNVRSLAMAIGARLEERGEAVKVGRLPPGVLVDGVVLAKGGMPGVTVSRGDWSTLGVVHTERDTRDRVDVRAAVVVGRAVAAAVRQALIDGAGTPP